MLTRLRAVRGALLGGQAAAEGSGDQRSASDVKGRSPTKCVLFSACLGSLETVLAAMVLVNTGDQLTFRNLPSIKDDIVNEWSGGGGASAVDPHLLCRDAAATMRDWALCLVPGSGLIPCVLSLLDLWNLFSMDRCVPLLVRDLNSHLICTLCKGYLVDATTITECLHSCEYCFSANGARC